MFPLLDFAQTYLPPEKYSAIWIYESLGIFYSTVIPLSGLQVLVGACLLIALDRGPRNLAYFFIFVPFPLLLGLYGTIDGSIHSFSWLGSGSGPDSHHYAEGIASALFCLQYGILFTIPGFLVTSIGLFISTLKFSSNL